MRFSLVSTIAFAAILFAVDAVGGQWWRLRPAPTPTPVRRAPPAPVASPKAKATPEIYVALPNYDEDTATRLQIFLDNNDFGPGKIDGKMGEFFRKALISYKHSHLVRETGFVDQWLLDPVPGTFTTYTIKPYDLKFIGSVPTCHSEQAKLKALLYGSLLEFVAERYHSAEAYIQKLNPGKNGEGLQRAEVSKGPNFLQSGVEKFQEGKVA